MNLQVDIQRACEAIGRDNHISYVERGIKYIPVYDPLEFGAPGWTYYIWGGGLILV